MYVCKKMHDKLGVIFFGGAFANNFNQSENAKLNNDWCVLKKFVYYITPPLRG